MYYYQEDITEVCSHLNTDLSNGLSEIEAKNRLLKYGPNKLKEEKTKSPITILLRQFLSPLMYILLIATIASLIIKETSDAIVISIAVIINVIIGFVQEYKAEKAASELKKYEVHRCNIKREGKVRSIEAKYLVPGDIVHISAGSRIPADIRLSYTAELTIEEAILTGESNPIKKLSEKLSEKLSIGDRSNIGHSGTYAISGKAEGIVIATGTNTELGKIGQLIAKTKQAKTPLQKQIKKFSWFLGWLMLSITGLVLLLGLIRGLPPKEIITISIALAIAAIPEGLLIAVTVVLAIGMQRMLKRKALVRHLIAAETLGSVSVICTDKTGTLTKGHMEVDKIEKFATLTTIDNKITDEEIFRLFVLNNDSQIKQRIGNPTEVALLQAALDNNIEINNIQKKFPRIDEKPFSSQTKYMATVHKFDNNKINIILKGAPEKVLSMSKIDENSKIIINKKYNEMTKTGLRVIAFSQIFLDSNNYDLNSLSNLNFVCLVGLKDPLREHASQTISDLKLAGIKTILVTGDHAETAKQIAHGAGIHTNNNIITGDALENMSDEELYNNISNIDIFARVDPKHKIRIVKSWKKRGESVAMIGDGVNDAPALKAADIGIALGSGSDVSHEISDMVLLDNNLSTISAAVKQGRIIFDNIRKIIVYLMADSFSEIILILGSILAGLPLPMLATQILWINLATDGFPHLALTMEPGEPEIMKEKPRRKDEPIMNKEMKILIFMIGIITDIGLFILYLFLLNTKMPIKEIRTIIFTALAIDSLFYVFSVRTMRNSIFRVNPFKNKWLNLSIVAGLAVQLSAVYLPFMQKLFHTIPLGLKDWSIVILLALVKILLIEITKEIFIARRKIRV